MDLNRLLLSDRVRDAQAELIGLRRRFHAMPELSGLERQTQQTIMQLLSESGLRPVSRADTGVICRIDGRQAGPVILMRADLDGLAVEEQTGLAFASRNPGCMHACGHDAHLAMALVAARLLAAKPPERGAVVLAFQPAEELGQGAARMIAEGLLSEQAIDLALAFHVWSGLPLGRVVCQAGAAMASVDSFALNVHGSGTHAARPEDGIDPIPIAAQIVSAAQSLISRRKPPGRPAVLSFTAISGGSAFNVIPEAVRLQGTLRCFDSALRDRMLGELRSLAAGLAEALGASVGFESFEQLPPLENDPIVAARVRQVAAGFLGEQAVAPDEPLMAGEDFGLFLQRVPGAMVLLGCADPNSGQAHPHHHPRFDLDERVLNIGLELWLRLVESFLE